MASLLEWATYRRPTRGSTVRRSNEGVVESVGSWILVSAVSGEWRATGSEQLLRMSRPVRARAMPKRWIPPS